MKRVQSLVAGGPLQEVAQASLSTWPVVGKQIAILGRRLLNVARRDPAVRRLMTAPGVGAVIAMTYVLLRADAFSLRR